MTTVTLSHAKAQLAKLLSDVERLGEEVIITRSGRPIGILLSLEEYEGLIETLEILADPDLSQSVRNGLDDVETGKILTHEEVWNELDSSVHE
jgi:antitoxin YefM